MDLAEVSGRLVTADALERLREYERMVVAENARQNLVSRGTIGSFWTRHVIDSAQLLRFVPQLNATWADVGSGAGLPGVVVACIGAGKVTLIEPRALRADFLRRVVATLELDAEVIQAKAERVRGSFDVVTARAVTALDRLLHLSQSFSTSKTRFLFPKGKSARIELAAARREWHGSFHVEQSVTDVDSFIIVAQDVKARIG